MLIFSQKLKRAKTLHFYLLVLALTMAGSLAYGDLTGQELQRNAYTFLHVPTYARLAGLGGVNVSLHDREVSSFFSNPSLAGDTLVGVAGANHQFYLGDIGNSSFAYVANLPSIGPLGIGVHHFGYGSMEGYDASGNSIGSFSLSETALVISRAHQIGAFRLGASIKGVFSSLAGFRSSAVLFDLGGLFVHPEKDFTLGLVIKNVGFVLSDYSDGSQSTVPFDVQFGSTFKPEHMPLRFSLTVYRLIQSRALGFDDNYELVKARMLEKVLRHFNFATEILLHRNVNLLVGYNYGIHQELKLPNAGGAAGITYGLSTQVKSFELVVSRSTYVAGSAAYSFSLSANLGRMLRR